MARPQCWSSRRPTCILAHSWWNITWSWSSPQRTEDNSASCLQKSNSQQSPRLCTSWHQLLPEMSSQYHPLAMHECGDQGIHQILLHLCWLSTCTKPWAYATTCQTFPPLGSNQCIDIHLQLQWQRLLGSCGSFLWFLWNGPPAHHDITKCHQQAEMSLCMAWQSYQIPHGQCPSAHIWQVWSIPPILKVQAHHLIAVLPQRQCNGQSYGQNCKVPSEKSERFKVWYPLCSTRLLKHTQAWNWPFTCSTLSDAMPKIITAYQHCTTGTQGHQTTT